MRKPFTVLTICFAIILTGLEATNSYSQPVNWLWAMNDRGTGDASQASSVAIDSRGNILVTGYFNGTSITLGANTLTNVSAGSYDVYVVKYSPTGSVLWARSAGGTNNDWGYTISTDSADNVYVSGYFNSSSITFGATTLTNGNPPYGDSFLVKYDVNGNVIWAINDVTSAASNSMNSITNTPTAIYGGGVFQASSITFGSQTVNNANSPNQSPYLVKFNRAGAAIWAKAPTGNTANDYLSSVSADLKGDIFATGYFASSSLTFGANTIMNTGGYRDVFIVKYDTNGNAIWAKNAGGSDGDAFGESVATDGKGNVYVAGYFNCSTITFGAVTLTDTGYTYSTSFLVKYSANGNVLWARTPGANTSNAMFGVWADSKGVYGGGTFQGTTIQFGTHTLNNPAAPDESPYLVKYDTSGKALWAYDPTGENSTYNRIVSIAGTQTGDVAIAGYFASSSLTFGALPAITNVTPGANDMYAAYLYDSTTATEGIAELANSNSVLLYPNPFSTSIMVEFEGNQNLSGSTYFILCDVVGREVMSRELKNQKTDISRGSLPNGMYLYKIQNDSGILKSGKLIIN